MQEERGLAGPVRAEERHPLPGRDTERHGAQRGGAVRVVVVEALDLERRGSDAHGRSAPAREARALDRLGALEGPEEERAGEAPEAPHGRRRAPSRSEPHGP